MKTTKLILLISCLLISNLVNANKEKTLDDYLNQPNVSVTIIKETSNQKLIEIKEDGLPVLWWLVGIGVSYVASDYAERKCKENVETQYEWGCTLASMVLGGGAKMVGKGVYKTGVKAMNKYGKKIIAKVNRNPTAKKIFNYEISSENKQILEGAMDAMDAYKLANEINKSIKAYDGVYEQTYNQENASAKFNNTYSEVAQLTTSKDNGWLYYNNSNNNLGANQHTVKRVCTNSSFSKNSCSYSKASSKITSYSNNTKTEKNEDWNVNFVSLNNMSHTVGYMKYDDIDLDDIVVSPESITDLDDVGIIGLRGGLSYSVPLIENRYNINPQEELDLGSFDLISGEIGIVYRIFFIETGINYIQRENFLRSNDILEIDGNNVSRVMSEKNQMGYLNFPLIVHLPVLEASIYIGGYASYQITHRGRINFNDTYTDDNGQLVNTSNTFDINYDDLERYPEFNYNNSPNKKWDLGIVGGINIPLFDYFNLDLRYYHGMNNINNKDNWGNEHSRFRNKINHAAYSIGVSYMVELY
jgi:hypothetical protein